MQGNHLFEYAVIRMVPHVEREEFLNIGIVLFCAPQKFLQAKFELDKDRLKILCDKLDFEDVNGHITAFQRICAGGKEAGPIGMLSMAERFRWLTAARSTILQSSKVHPGLCNDPQEMLERLFVQLVARV